MDHIHDVTDDFGSVLKVLLIGHLLFVYRIPTGKLWIGRWVGERCVKLVGSFEVGLKLALNIIEFLLVLKMGCHVIQVRNLVTKFVKEVVFLFLVDIAVTAWLIAWITWVLFISITRVRLS